jgi:hypothetical protein
MIEFMIWQIYRICNNPEQVIFKIVVVTSKLLYMSTSGHWSIHAKPHCKPYYLLGYDGLKIILIFMSQTSKNFNDATLPLYILRICLRS